MNRGVPLLLRQVGHELTSLRRTPITLILSVGFPLVFFILIAALIGNEVLDERSGVRLAQFVAPAFAAFGVVMSTFSFLAVGFAEARANGVLKRQAGTPLPTWALIGGRMGAALVLGLLAVVLVLGVGVAFYDVQVIARTAPAALLTIVVASASFSACGLALAALLPSMQATLAVTNGLVIPLAFFSDIFFFGGSTPAWMSSVGWVFPLKHLVNAFGDALNPYLTGSGLYLDHLAVIALWGVAGAAVATWALRRERDRTAGVRATAGRASSRDAAPRRTARPGALTLLGAQVAHTNATLWRDAGNVFFAVAFPVLLVAIIPTANGGGDQRLDNGMMLGTFFAATMAVYGAAVTCYVNMPEGIAESRDTLVLKRVRATPLPLPALLGGRVVGAVWVALITLAAIWVLATVMYGTALPPDWAGVLVTFLASVVCFAVLGLAVASLVRTGQAFIGVALGTLLPLAFVSDVFVVGAAFPPWLDTVSWVFPLRHATRSMTQAVDAGALGAGFGPGHLAVLAAWTLAGLAVVAWRFSWVPRDGAVRRPAAARRRRPAR